MNLATIEQTEEYQMGWNDLLGNLRQAHAATNEEKRIFCQKQANTIDSGKTVGALTTQDTKGYRQGVVAACGAFLSNKDMEYLGPESVVESLQNMETSGPTDHPKA